MASVRHYRPLVCGCSFNLADNGDGTHRYLTRQEAINLHQQEYDAEPWRGRLFQALTGDTTTHKGIPEDDPQVALLLAAGWVNCHDIYPDFPARFKNVLNPASAPQPFPKLCPAHQALGHAQIRYDAVLHESRRLQTAGTIYATRMNRAEFDYSLLGWAFSADTVATQPGARMLLLKPTIGNNTDKTFLQNAINLEYGPGQVVVS